jgi:GNAT superfamily N-acetyltransferase
MVIRTAVVPLPEIFQLRWEILRPGLPPESAEFPEDADPAAFHIAAYDTVGTVLGCGSFYPEPVPGTGAADEAAYRIRGMASADRARGQGYGAAVLETGTEEAMALGARVMWCNGRTEARGFYERHGYATPGEEFLIEGVGPHYVFVRRLD